MKTEQKLIALAKLDGVKPDEWFCVECNKAVPSEHVTNNETHDVRFGGCGNFCNDTAPYLTNGDEIRRLIGKQSWKVQCEVAIQYRIACQEATTACPTYIEGWMVWIMLAPATPLVNALLKATGNWVE